jgi:hypothetical protein
VVDHLTQDPKFEGSNPATAYALRERNSGKNVLNDLSISVRHLNAHTCEDFSQCISNFVKKKAIFIWVNEMMNK